MPTRRYPLRIDIDLIVPVIVIGLLAGLIIPRWLLSPLTLLRDIGFVVVAGFLCILAAKISLFRRGIWGSWGPKMMTTGWARLYKFGYVVIGIGILLTLLFYKTMR